MADTVLDNYNPHWVWFSGGALCVVSQLGFLWLHLVTRQRFSQELPPAPVSVQAD
jgi:hypothetical protein